MLDPDRLTALVGRPVRATHLRPKPGVSTTAALVDGEGRPWGWIRTLTGDARAKAGKARAVAEEVGLADRLGEAELTGRDTVVQWGPVATDLRLARELARVAAALGDARREVGPSEPPGSRGSRPPVVLPVPGVHGSAEDLVGRSTILRYNPLRRLVLRHDDLVLRVTADRHRRRLERTTRPLVAAGIPVVGPWRSPADPASDGPPHTASSSRSRSHPAASSRTSVWPWVPGKDASGITDPGVLRAVGEALGRLHRADPAGTSDLPDVPRRGWSELRAAAADSVALLEQVAPGAASAAARALALLPEENPGPHVPLVLVHGDFSLDQCLVPVGRHATDEPPVVHRPTHSPIVRLTDLDRAALAVPVLDHAVLLATALADDDPVLTAPEALAALADGYATTTGASLVVPGPWVAAALLARVAEPWRAQRPGWHAETARRSLLAARLVPEQDAWPRATRAPAPSDAGSPVASPTTTVLTTSTPGDAAPSTPVEPAAAGRGDDARHRIGVDRAWPGRVRNGFRETTVEGRDHLGRVRAGTVGRDGIPRFLPPAEDPRLPALARVADGEVVVHRAGRRAVVRTGEGYVKVLRPGRAPAVAEAGRVGAGLARAAGLAAPTVLAVDDDTVTFARLPGRSVHELSGSPQWTQVWRDWARAWTRLQELDGLVADLPRHTAADEAEVVLTWVDRAQEAGLLDDRWVERGRWVADRLRSAGFPGRLVPTHRDLHDKQLLWDGPARGGPRLGVLDLDTVCLADPVLDPVNLAVHADLRRAQGLWAPASSEVVVGAVGEVLGELGHDGVAASRRAELATVVRLVCVYAFRPRWRGTVDRWAEERWARALDETFLIDVSPPSPADRASWVS
ncbi:phosphotransferase [Ornithinimicrobium sp. W1679]|uniref:phosphotransferase n=1 Tax=Ornithinimicrobium sp. W1679 TaxID=3418770 RepID=UPI003CF71FB0